MPKKALLSVSDKSGLIDFAKGLIKADFELLSTGGTQKVLEEASIPVTPVEDLTEFPECFSGRVKTMHPKVMGGILYRRGDSQHEEEASKLGIDAIDIVVVNLYPFEDTVAKGITGPELIEQIDIGGPTLLRSAAKNFHDVTVICDIADYDRVLEEINSNGDTSLETRQELSVKVFERTMAYDAAITSALSEGQKGAVLLTNRIDLRYGENPHQEGAFYEKYGEPKPWTVLQEEKQMSYLNILDADGAWNLVSEFPEPTAACIKHANPSGVASDNDIAVAFQKSYDADRLSAFGVIIALNRECTEEIIAKIIEQKIFVEIIIAPSYSDAALERLKSKKKIRVLQMDGSIEPSKQTCRTMLGGVLVQDQDTKVLTKDDLTCVTDTAPSDAQIADLLFAWEVVKHTKSNAIVFAKDQVTVGIGCGQTSRVDSTIIAVRRAGDRAQGAVMASDAFFPFPDSIEEAAKNGIAAIIQPGGSIRDGEVIAKANELGIPMVVTGIRGFRH
ncbi:MAG: bifunctional phosphoribosylaminoimidazolecarboxamide formyltransferase/IMP cyclohydrolase [bacterium]|nr:bifunctional phosphoribosylaminoimidazolecarboxamide formyltransferase/IMP cyclohydrolase [bacterium]